MSMSFKASPDGTYGEILVNGAVVAKLPVTGNAVIPNLVGTASQSGGVPTGAVVERGSNANGQYVRFADGTQICWANKIIATTISGVANGIWNYPATFASVPTNVLSILTSSPSNYLPGVGNDTTSNVQHYVWSDNAGVSIGGRAIAVGRWF